MPAADAAAAPGLPRLCELVPLAGAFTFPTPPLDTPGGPLTGVTQSACLLEHCAGTLGCNSALFLPSAQSCVLYRETLDEVGMDASDPGYESEALLLYCRQDAALPPPAPTGARTPRRHAADRCPFRHRSPTHLPTHLQTVTDCFHRMRYRLRFKRYVSCDLNYGCLVPQTPIKRRLC